MGACDADDGSRLGCGKIGEELRDADAREGNAKSGCDFGERNEDKGALGKTRVRDFEAGIGKDEIVVEEKVEVEGARAIEGSAGAIAAEEAFDGEKSVEKVAGRKRSFEGQDSVEEAGLIGNADGRGGVERRTRGDAAERGDTLQGCGKSGIGRAGGAGKIGAEGDKRERHCNKGSKLAGRRVGVAYVGKFADWLG